MKLIRNENKRILIYTALFLIVFGLFISAMGYLGKNDATTFAGLSFSFLSVICFLLIRTGKVRLAKISWGMVTPLLLFVSPLLYSLNQPTSVISYGYLYIGAMMFSAYSFQEKSEKKYMWMSIGLFFIAILFYDRIIIHENFEATPIADLFITNYSYFKIAQVVHFISLVYFINMIQVNKVSIEKQLSRQIIKLQKFTANLIGSAKNTLIHSGVLVEALEEMLRNTAQVLNVSRLSVWEFDEEDQSINMIVCYDLEKNNFTYSGKLVRSEYPIYFKYLMEEKLILANDAMKDSRTSEFAVSYLAPLSIKSMMDAPFFIDGKFKGILCCEEQRTKRQWDEMDQLFSLAISKLISISYYCCMRKEQYSELIKASKELENRNVTIEQVNEKIQSVNENLENKLDGKKEEMKEMQKFIDDVSFKNAHQVRGPLSRILGLVSLYQKDTDAENRKQYMSYIEKSATDLDEIIKEVSELLNKSYATTQPIDQSKN
jgi:hypothetical protein